MIFVSHFLCVCSRFHFPHTHEIFSSYAHSHKKGDFEICSYTLHKCEPLPHNGLRTSRLAIYRIQDGKPRVPREWLLPGTEQRYVRTYVTEYVVYRGECEYIGQRQRDVDLFDLGEKRGYKVELYSTKNHEIYKAGEVHYVERV